MLSANENARFFKSATSQEQQGLITVIILRAEIDWWKIKVFKLWIWWGQKGSQLIRLQNSGVICILSKNWQINLNIGMQLKIPRNVKDGL